MVFELTLVEWVTLALAAFAGGAFGASIGALPALSVTGLLIVVGEAANVLKAELGAAGVVEPGAVGVGITGSIALGPVFGPHVSFAGGVAAAAYAARKGYMDTGFDYYEAKNVVHALGTRPDVLAVGGAFGILGMVVRQVSAAPGVSAPWDPVAMGIVVSAVAHRLALGYPLVGRARGDGFLDMTPFQRRERRESPENGGAVSNGGTRGADRYAVEPWLPHQYRWSNVAAIGLVTGILAAVVAVRTGSAFLAFGISAATLAFLSAGIEGIPVTHHMTLPAATAALALSASGTPPVLPALAVGGIFGITSALTGELVQRVFYAHADTHFDPPGAAIVVNTLFIAVLALAGVFPSAAWIPMP